MDGLVARNAALISSPRGFLTYIAGIITTLVLVRSFLFPGVGGDDGEQMVFSQYFDWGYQLRNPPLVTWLLIVIQQITGPTVFSIVLLRGLILFAIYALSLAVALELVTDRRLAALSAGSLLMIFYVGWNTIHGFTHTSLVTAFYLAALLLILRLGKAPTVPLRIAFGAALGFGILAKYSFVIFAIALVIAAMFDRDKRRAMVSPWVALGVAVTLPLVLPQFAWLAEHAPSQHLVRGNQPLDWIANLGRIVETTLRVAASTVAFFLPFGLIWLVVFWKAVRQLPAQDIGTAHHARFLEHLFLAIAAIAFVAIAVVQSDRPRSHYLFVLVPLVPYLFLRFGAAMTDRQVRRYAALISLSGVVLIGTLVGKYFIEPLIHEDCEDHVPYDTFADKLREAGFKRGTIFAYFHRDPLAGNLRVRFPESRVVSAKHPGAIPPAGETPGQCLIIWPLKGAEDPKSATIRTANESRLATKLSYEIPSKVTSASLPPWGNRRNQIGFALIEGGAGDCR